MEEWQLATVYLSSVNKRSLTSLTMQLQALFYNKLRFINLLEIVCIGDEVKVFAYLASKLVHQVALHSDSAKKNAHVEIRISAGRDIDLAVSASWGEGPEFIFVQIKRETHGYFTAEVAIDSASRQPGSRILETFGWLSRVDNG